MRGKVQGTLETIRFGIAVIYQPRLRHSCLFGTAYFLRKVPSPSGLDDFSYEDVYSKLARCNRTIFVVKLAFYSPIK
ncbi:MAG: hypothetical protein K9K79_01630 [Desulfohalobiaceae bacterium]|nr:hypothetical protein [Desulfohalobiaceae bacterium]